MAKVIWTEPALSDLDAIADYIALDKPIAWWAYEQGEAAGAHAWIDAERFVRLDGSWRGVLGSGGLRRVAEPPPPEYRPE